MALFQLPLVYLDWNIFDGLSKGRFAELGENLITARDAGIIHVPYSEWHLYEAVHTRNSSALDELASRNLDAIRKYSNLVYVWEDDNPQGWIIGRAAKDSIFDTSTAQRLVEISELLKPILAAFTVVREQVIPYGLQPGVLNKYPFDEVIAKINELLLMPTNIEKYKAFAPNGITYEELVRMSLRFMPESTDEIQQVAGIYFMVDQLGYYSDKSIQNNVMSLWRDSMHVGWASRGQMLVSDDERLRMKALLTYHTLGIQTPVLDPQMANLVLSDLIENGDEIKRAFTQCYESKNNG